MSESSKGKSSAKSSTSDLNKGKGQGQQDSENVRVVVRCRPLSRKEEEKGCKQIVEVNSDTNSVQVQGQGEQNYGQDHNQHEGSSGRPSSQSQESAPKTFTFDAVFVPGATQADVYNEVARPIVENVLQGYNGTIFAYGQTGTGKTFTMEGVYNVPELKGIIPNSFAQIFAHIGKAEGDQRFLVRCSYLEIYNEDVRDLLAKTSNARLEVKEHKDKGVYVKDLSSFVVRNADDMDKIMGIGNKNRSVASTNMNSVSSRSHAIFTITVECSMEHKYVEGEVKDKSGRSFRVGKLNLVDLAGSERLSKTQATGDRLKEATKINLSLSNLGNVISALVEGNPHIPYRNSKLTRLLQDSLGGNSKTVMVANIGPADYNYDETVSTLRFANRAKNIKNHAVINEDPKDALLRQFEKEIQELRKQLEDGGVDGAVSGSGESPNEGGEGPDPDEEALMGIKGELENHKMLSSTIGTESQDRNTVMTALKDKVMTWKETEAQKLSLQQKLQTLQRKILVGGENLLDKSQQQEELLLNSMKELSLRREEEAKLQSHLQKQEEDRQNLEKKILSCQEQNLAISKKLKKVYNQYTTQKQELEHFRLEYQEETDALAEEVQKLSRELQYHSLIIDNFIPPTYQNLIEKSVKWQPDSGEWSLKCIAYAGNNMTRGTGSGAGDSGSGRRGEPSARGQGQGQSHHHQVTSVDLSFLYLDISDPTEAVGKNGMISAASSHLLLGKAGKGGSGSGSGSSSSRPQSSLLMNRPSSAQKNKSASSANNNHHYNNHNHANISFNSNAEKDKLLRSRMGF